MRISNGLTGILSGERGRGCHDGGDGDQCHGDHGHGHGVGGQVVMVMLLLVLWILAMEQLVQCLQLSDTNTS